MLFRSVVFSLSEGLAERKNYHHLETQRVAVIIWDDKDTATYLTRYLSSPVLSFTRPNGLQRDRGVGAVRSHNFRCRKLGNDSRAVLGQRSAAQPSG